MLHPLAVVAVIALLSPAAAVAQALPTPDDPIAHAESAGIPEIAADATILDAEGNVIRQGTNGWTCIAMPASRCVPTSSGCPGWTGTSTSATRWR